MKTKLIILTSVLVLVPSVANASRGYHMPKMTMPHTTRISGVGQYHLTYHRTQRVKCSYSGCRSDYKN